MTGAQVVSGIAAAQATASAAIPSAQIGAAGGVAGLDGNGNVTAPVASRSITVQDSYTASSGLPTVTPRIKLYRGALDALAGGPDAVWMGGFSLPSVSGAAGDPATSAIVNIAARPYGNFNNGCALCLFSTGGTQTDGAGRAAISGADWHEGVSANAGMGDIVGFYEHLDNSPARLILPVTAYTATSVTLASALTAEQINQLRAGMYIWSNSIDTSLTDTGSSSGQIPTARFYGGYVTGWSGNTITVNGWSVFEQPPGAGAVPDVTKLDASVYSNRTTPTVWIGSPGKVFARNVYASYVEPTAGAETSLAHEYQAEEADFATYAKTPHSVKYSGYVLSPQSYGALNDGTEFTEDSAGVVVAGSLPIQISLWGGCNSSAIYGQSIYVASHCSKFDSSTAVGSTYTLSENVAIAGGMSYRQITRLQQDVAGANPNLYVGPVVTPGINPSVTNRTQSWYGHVNGYVNGAIKYGLSDSSVALCGSGTACGLTVSGSGDITVGPGNTLAFTPPGTVTSRPFLHADDSNTLHLQGSSGDPTNLIVSGAVQSGGVATSAGVQSNGDVETMNGHSVVVHPATQDNTNGSPFFSAPDGAHLKLGNSGGTNTSFSVTGVLGANAGVTSGSMSMSDLNNVYRPAQDGTQMWCSDCKLNGVTGVAAFYHANGTKWTDSQNNALAN
ncbi:hypothetical protein [Gluconobacter albidus]|uniref:hypothetical protein n=1 Tax=Gluconobacter albidus TaxID=318683 RepID=UPI001B8D5DD8|nr:hypothetical protein [Gluconobacter albidus]MBS1028325.1 hypothetical protein [Gluconobacter albidus]